MSNLEIAIRVLQTGVYLPPAPELDRAPTRRLPRPKLPASDADPDDGGSVVHDYLGKAYMISYRDARGAESTRRITLREIRTKNDILHLWAYCHERSAVRLFCVDRIQEMIDLHTGEILDIVTFCASHAREDSTAAALRELRQEIAVLAFLARCDGHFHEFENAAIVDHVLDRRNYDPSIRQDVLSAEIAKVRADSHLFENGVVAIGRMGEGRLRQFERAIIKVIDADGIIHPAEHAIASNLVDIIADRRDYIEKKRK